METTQNTTQERAQQRKAKHIPKAPLPKTSTHLNELLEWYGSPTTRSVKYLHRHYARDAFFKDPFRELYTTEDLQKYYHHSLEKIHDVHFSFENVLEHGHQAFVTWVMMARFMGREFSVQGTSHLKFNSSGLCEYHRDYFDLSGEIYEHLPLLGYVFKGLKRALN
ncbi:MAG: nuclear transport factor 2 family protein [Pseudobdellovibrionaceae bacterium]